MLKFRAAAGAGLCETSLPWVPEADWRHFRHPNRAPPSAPDPELLARAGVWPGNPTYPLDGAEGDGSSAQSRSATVRVDTEL